ncbi:MAG TPA: RNA-binding protein, partial [Actinomycetospora sp.]|nr:RNA-binding protein [Actinomycetospora sp.]
MADGTGDPDPPGDEAGTDAAAGTGGDPEADAAARAAVRARLLERAPDPVRAKVAELVATAVGHLPLIDLPPPVRPVARFAPAKRARAGAAPLLAAVGSAEGFAARVVAWWTEEQPDRWRP